MVYSQPSKSMSMTTRTIPNSSTSKVVPFGGVFEVDVDVDVEDPGRLELVIEEVNVNNVLEVLREADVSLIRRTSW